jgi:hypothetical protein
MDRPTRRNQEIDFNLGSTAGDQMTGFQLPLSEQAAARISLQTQLVLYEGTDWWCQPYAYRTPSILDYILLGAHVRYSGGLIPDSAHWNEEAQDHTRGQCPAGALDGWYISGQDV